MAGNSLTKRQVGTGQQLQASAMDDEDLRQEIALRAYQRYRDRGSAQGFEMEDWLAAEREVLAKRTNAAVHSSSEATASNPRSRRRTKQSPARS